MDAPFPIDSLEPDDRRQGRRAVVRPTRVRHLPARTDPGGDARGRAGDRRRHGLLGATNQSGAFIVGAAFSGQGFQLASTLGEIAADLTLNGVTNNDIVFLAPDRTS